MLCALLRDAYVHPSNSNRQVTYSCGYPASWTSPLRSCILLGQSWHLEPGPYSSWSRGQTSGFLRGKIEIHTLFVTAVRKLLHDSQYLHCVLAERSVHCTNYKWTTEYLLDSLPRFRDVIPRAGLHSLGMSLASFA